MNGVTPIRSLDDSNARRRSEPGAALVDDSFGRQLRDYNHWRQHLADAVKAYREWRESLPREDAAEDGERPEELRLYELVESLRTDKLNIALVGEFSRGKTELINAIFFSTHDRRLLPSAPGRTTMCPMEIMYDPEVEPCIKLLPIETRKSGLTIQEHKRTPINWTTLAFNMDSADDIAGALREVIKGKTVTRREAEELCMLSLLDDAPETDGGWEVPVWRHAIVNYPHPLLEQGLVVLDTPGLNALGTEPELTYSMLPSAHAIVFVLAADTGVTRSDLQIWNDYLCTASVRHCDARIAALNKIDTLWDDLNDDAELAGYIERQAEETRRLLDIARPMVFPVSAKKGLIAKINRDTGLEERSGLPALERKLSGDIVAYKRRLIQAKVVTEVGTLVESSRQLGESRIAVLETELAELQQLHGKSNDVINDIVEKLRNHKESHAREVQAFHVTQRILADETQAMRSALSMPRFDALVASTRQSMTGSWTTHGLRERMADFFSSTSRVMEQVQAHADQIHALANRIYQQFHKNHQLPRMRPARFSVEIYVRQFNHLYEDATRFRNSPATLMTEQHFVIQKFFITLVSRARIVFEECNQGTRSWTKSVLTPISTQITEHGLMIDRRLENLERFKQNHASLGERTRDLDRELASLRERQAIIEDIVKNLDKASERPAESGQLA